MSPTKRRLIITLATLLLVAMAPAVVMAAGGQFTDDDDSIFEDHIEWLADAGVTAGCNPPANDHFCPNDNVNRGQMAAFMRRFAQYIGAEDGIVSEADHAATAAEATSAESADNANTVDGKHASQFQPATYAFDGNNNLAIESAQDYDVATVSVTTTDATGWLCLVGQSPKADMFVRASGYTLGVDSGESAWLWLEANGTKIEGTDRYFTHADSGFAVEWLYQGNGGAEDFTLVVHETSGTDDWDLSDASLSVEVVKDTRCTGLIWIFPGEPGFDPPVDG